MTQLAMTGGYAQSQRMARPAKEISILIVDADPTMQGHYDAILHRAGLHLLGPAHHSSSALHLLAAHHPDAAILDVQPDHPEIWELADALAARGICFVLTSDAPLNADDIPPAHQDAVRLTKPFTREQLLMGLRLVCEAFH